MPKIKESAKNAEKQKETDALAASAQAEGEIAKESAAKESAAKDETEKTWILKESSTESNTTTTGDSTDNMGTTGSTGTAGSSTATDGTGGAGTSGRQDSTTSGSSSANNRAASSSDVTKYQAEYTVRDGDTLAIVCRMYYGNLDKLQEICDLNGITDPNTILPGQKIVLP